MEVCYLIKFFVVNSCSERFQKEHYSSEKAMMALV